MWVISSHQFTATGTWQKLLLDLAECLVIIALSIPTVVWAWHANGLSRAFRYFIVCTIGVGSVIATMSVLFLDFQGNDGSIAAWIALWAALTALILYFVGDWISLVVRLTKAIRADRRRGRSQDSAGSPPV
jgi:hypothetical protein